jgi:DUF1680 family protein
MGSESVRTEMCLDVLRKITNHWDNLFLDLSRQRHDFCEDGQVELALVRRVHLIIGGQPYRGEKEGD